MIEMGAIRLASVGRVCLMVALTLLVRDAATQEQDLFFPYGPEHGDTELPKEDDTGVEFDISIRYFPFFDQNHKSLYVNTNGVISFLQNVEQYTPESFPLGNNRRLIAPYWADVDITKGGHVYYRESTDPVVLRRATDEVARVFAVDFRFNPFKADWLLIATWDKVAFYNAHGIIFGNRENTFQAVLITDSVYSFTIFNYGEIQWTTGSASFGNKQTGLAGDNEQAVPAQVGFNAGNGVNFYSVPNSQTDAILNINSTTNVRKPGRWMFRIDGKEIEVAGCQNDRDGTLRISPSQVVMLGGDVLSISGPCFNAASDVFCRIHDYEIQASYDFTRDPFTVRCATPLFMSLGETPVYLSKNGGENYNYTGYITVVGMDRMPPRVAASENRDVMTVTWQKNGYPFTNSPTEDDVRVDAFLYSYTEDPRTGTVRLKPVLQVVDNRKLTNGFESLLKPRIDEQFDVGVYRVVQHGTVDISQPGISVVMGVPGTHSSQAPIASMWSLPFNANPDGDQTYAGTWCRDWAASEPLLDINGDNLAQCPCTLRQARADVGTFEPYPWCDQSASGNKCPYRSQVVHCVRARRGSNMGRGQLCCYDNTDNIVLMEDNYEGGSSQSHFNGGHTPAGYPGNVPYLSNFLGDRVPWEQCCPRTGYTPGLCELYRVRRPSSDCKYYLPPKPATVFGEPHFISFDGTKYIFNGYGEFTLVSSPGANLTIQGRMEQITDSVQATGLTVVTMKVGDSDTVQVELNDRRTMDVWARLQTQGTWQQLEFEHSGWWTSRPRGTIVELIGAEESQGVRVIFNQGTAFEARAPVGASAMALKVLAAPSLRGDTTGLLGSWNDDPSDDLKAPKSGAIFTADSLTTLHTFFGVKWYIPPNSSLFRYDISVNVSTINRPDFQAVYTLDSTLNETELSAVCGDSQVCRYDYQKTLSPEMGTGAKDAEEDYERTRTDTMPVDSCGYLSGPNDGSKSGTVYLNGSTLTFTCYEGFELTGSASRQCIQKVWQGNVTVCIPPEPFMRDLLLIIIIASVLGGILLLVLCFLCAICCCRRRRRSTAKKQHADHELGTISGVQGIQNGALVTTPLASDRTPSANSSVIEDPDYERSLQRQRAHEGSAFPFPESQSTYMTMRGNTASGPPSRPPRDYQLANPVEGPGYRGSTIASGGPGYRSAETTQAGPSHTAGSSMASARPIPRDPTLSKQPKSRAQENYYGSLQDPRDRLEKAKIMKGSIIKDPNTSQYDSDSESSEDDITRIKRQLRREVEEEDAGY